MNLITPDLRNYFCEKHDNIVNSVEELNKHFIGGPAKDCLITQIEWFLGELNKMTHTQLINQDLINYKFDLEDYLALERVIKMLEYEESNH